MSSLDVRHIMTSDVTLDVPLFLFTVLL